MNLELKIFSPRKRLSRDLKARSPQAMKMRMQWTRRTLLKASDTGALGSKIQVPIWVRNERPDDNDGEGAASSSKQTHPNLPSKIPAGCFLSVSSSTGKTWKGNTIPICLQDHADPSATVKRQGPLKNLHPEWSEVAKIPRITTIVRVVRQQVG